MAPAFAHGGGELFLRVAEPVHQLAISLRLFDRIEVGALDILDDRDFENFGIIEIPHDDRNLVDLRPLGGPPTAFAGERSDSRHPSGWGGQ